MKRAEARAPRKQLLPPPQILTGIIFTIASSVAFAGEPKLPDLLPARGEMPPTWWEVHGLVVILGSLALLAVVALLILLFTRPKSAVVVPPVIIARRALEALRGQTEDDPLLVEVSGILRSYLTFACGLPPRERTTTELSHDLEAHPQLGQELAGSITVFLRQCDQRKFSPAPPPAPASAVDAALNIVTQVETRQQQQPQAVPPQPPANTVAATPS